jgi:glutamate/tyrosine decarboxylase-like PLP-dependent enzyme
MSSEARAIGSFLDVARLAEEVAERIAAGPVTTSVSAAEVRGHLARRYDFTRPLPLEDVLGDVEGMLGRWQVQVTHPRYFGLFNPSVTAASVAADALAAAYNPQLAAWSHAPAANEIERFTVRWLAGKLGYDPESSRGHFTSGGAEANLTAVLVALTRAFPAFATRGVRAIDAQPVLYVTGETHHSFHKIAQMTGLGRDAVRVVAVRDDLRLDLDDLARRVREDRARGLAPFLVVGTAGTTSAGIVDPLLELAVYCRNETLWFHVDAAWGGAAVLSPRLRPLVAGIARSDSITWDAHKWLSVPMAAGMFFCRHGEALRETFRIRTTYMPGSDTRDTEDPFETTAQWSRRFIGLKLFVSLAELGESGYAARIEHQVRVGDRLRAALLSSGWALANRTPLPLVCFTREGLDHGAFLARVREEQIAWISEAFVGDGRPVLRACVTSWRTTEAEVERVAEELTRIATS